jgi:hypothetical protein
VDWDEKASATFHKKNPKGPKNFFKRPLFDILYGRLKGFSTSFVTSNTIVNFGRGPLDQNKIDWINIFFQHILRGHDQNQNSINWALILLTTQKTAKNLIFAKN